jgi:glutathione S-transferase
MSALRVFTFSPAFGLPTGGPFALKLLKWLDIAGIAYEQVIEDDAGKGPNRKNPWIELDGRRIPDTEIIIDFLSERFGFDIDAGLETAERARLHAVRRMIEEHLHMVFEWEMFVHPDGFPFVRGMAEAMVPRPVATPMARMFCRQMKKQLHARGLARHSDDIIARKGIADVDAMETVIGGRPFLAGDRPSLTDVSSYGMLQPMARWPMHTPVADYIKSRPALVAYLDRMESLKAERRLAA